MGETNKVLCHRAKSLQDFAYALIKADMDTDFEDNCKEIIERRKKLTKKLSKPEERTAFDPNTNQIIPIKTDLASLNSASTSTSAKKSPIRKKRVRKSRWSSGFIAKPKAKPKDKDEDGEDKDEDKGEDKDKDTSVNANDLEQDNAEDSDFDGEVSLNETMGLKMDFNKLKQIEDD